MPSRPTRDLLAALAQVPDPRGRKGRRRSISAMLTAVVCAVLSGARGYLAIAQWLHLQNVATWHWMGFTRNPPTRNCFRDLLMTIDLDRLQEVVNSWIASLELPAGDQALQAVSIDGKTLCGKLSPHCQAIHLLAVLDQQTGCVLSQTEVYITTNEHKAALEFLKTLVLQGRVIVADAMFCQKDHCSRIRDGGGHYFVVVKDNQPGLKRDIQSAFAQTEGFRPYIQHEFNDDRQTHETREVSRGRLEHHQLTSTTVLNDDLDWPDVGQVCRIVRKTFRNGEETTDVQYALTSARRDQADAAQLLSWWRGQWKIENSLHWVRDVTLGEDASRIRTGDAPRNLAAVRNAIISCFRLEKTRNIAEAVRDYAWKPQRLFAKLGRRIN